MLETEIHSNNDRLITYLTVLAVVVAVIISSMEHLIGFQNQSIAF